MQAYAFYKNARISPRKARLLRGVMLGKSVAEVDAQLQFMQGKAPQVLQAVMRSAAANAVNNNDAEAEALVVSEVNIGDGITMKRAMPRSRGMSHPILKRTANIKVVVDDQAKGSKKSKKKAEIKDVAPEDFLKQVEEEAHDHDHEHEDEKGEEKKEEKKTAKKSASKKEEEEKEENNKKEKK